MGKLKGLCSTYVLTNSLIRKKAIYGFLDRQPIISDRLN